MQDISAINRNFQNNLSILLKHAIKEKYIIPVH